MQSKRFKVGDIFTMQIDNNRKKYFQYIANDITQLNSQVIRVFESSYSLEDAPNLENTIRDKVDFYAHVILSFGITLKKWEKVGFQHEIGNLNIMFRDSSDYGTPEIKISNNWWIWVLNKPQEKIGALKTEYQQAEIGIVINPLSIVHRAKTGRYDFIYPGY